MLWCNRSIFPTTVVGIFLGSMPPLANPMHIPTAVNLSFGVSSCGRFSSSEDMVKVWRKMDAGLLIANGLCCCPNFKLAKDGGLTLSFWKCAFNVHTNLKPIVQAIQQWALQYNWTETWKLIVEPHQRSTFHCIPVFHRFVIRTSQKHLTTTGTTFIHIRNVWLWQSSCLQKWMEMFSWYSTCCCHREAMTISKWNAWETKADGAISAAKIARAC